MKRIPQRSVEVADCGVACVAMVTDITYKEAFELLSKHEKNGEFYTRHKDLIEAIKILGYRTSLKRFSGFRNIKGTAIVATNKRKDGNWHWIVYFSDSFETFAYDPKPSKRGKIIDFRGLNGTGQYIQIYRA